MTSVVEVRADGIPLGAVLSVGSELLLGDLVDSNAAWLSRQLRDLGVDVVHHVSARDDLDELVDALRFLAVHARIIVVGGGLGPTSDDLTRDAISAAAGVELEFRDDLYKVLADRFASLGRDMPPQNARQARIPKGADVYPAVGTAPGFGLTVMGPHPARIIALPGVPWEMRELFARHVVDEVRALAGRRATVTRSIHVAGRGESDVASVIEPLLDGREGVTLAFLAHASAIEVRLTVTADDPQGARRASQPMVEEVVGALDRWVVGIDDESIEDTVVRLLSERGQRLATAESATAGDIAARIGRIPGASQALVGGAVVYGTDAKHDLLGIPTELLAEHGPVSEPVTALLASTVRQLTGADWGLAVTGVAGPDTVDDLPVGTCIWALAHPDGHVEVHQRRSPGDRRQVIIRLGTLALDLLRRRLLEQ